MWGPPKDVEGKCNAELHIADDYGDNHATMKCQLEPGHAGPHREDYTHTELDNISHEPERLPITITWEGDARMEDKLLDDMSEYEPDECDVDDDERYQDD
jgi:hypothetical protein